MLHRVERLTDLAHRFESEPGEDAQRLVAYPGHALHDGARVGVAVPQRQLEIVQHRQPRGGHGEALLLALPGRLPLGRLAGVLHVGGGPVPPLGQLRDVHARLGRLLLGDGVTRC